MSILYVSIATSGPRGAARQGVFFRNSSLFICETRIMHCVAYFEFHASEAQIHVKTNMFKMEVRKLDPHSHRRDPKIVKHRAPEQVIR